jgi:serine/threonine-protein kinase
VSPGRSIAGRYELGERLGVGGMSTVQEAFDRRLERHVAVKLLAEHLAEDPLFVSRFRREALSAARLVHPNIVQVFDFGLDEASGRHYIVMEVIRGKSGAEILRERGRLPVTEALELVGQSCRGLDYAHRNGVVHRDVKPGNLLRSDDGVIKLADFGIAKAVHEESSITQVGSVLGTASYLAPEQARGEEAGPAADLYALGVVTYQLLSGRLPYEANSLTELALKQQREAPAYLHELDPAIPEELSLAVDRALSLDPRERQSDAEALRRSLHDGAEGIPDEETGATRVTPVETGPTHAVAASPAPVPRRERTAEHPVGVAARVPRPAPAPLPVGPPSAAPPAPPARRGGGGTRRLLVGLLILGLVLAGGAAAVVATSQDERGTNLRRVTSDSVNGIVDELEQLIDDNTR